MRNNSLRTFLGALLVAGAMGAACSTHQRHNDTTVAQAPLGQSTADYPANPSVLPPDAAVAPLQSVGPTHQLSPGAVRGSTQGAPVTNPTGTPTNPNMPPPTPSSPNAPSSTPAPNPIPPTGGGPTSGTGGTNTGTGTGPTGTGNPTPPPTEEESTVPIARGTFDEPLDPYQARSDGGMTPPTAPRDGGIGGRSDAGVGGIGRGDAGAGGIRPRGDGGLR